MNKCHSRSNGRFCSGHVGGSGRTWRPSGVSQSAEFSQLPGGNSGHWAYHATDADPREIAKRGLRTHGPSHGTDQRAWPDAKTEKRAYFTDSPAHASAFGRRAVLRVARPSVPLHRESGTGDLYTRETVPARRIQILNPKGRWERIVKRGRT